MATTAGRRENRGRNRRDGAVRSDASASRRWRRTNRSVSAASSSGPIAGRASDVVQPSGRRPRTPGTRPPARARSRPGRPSRPSASTASAVSPSVGRARTPATSQREQSRRPGSRPPTSRRRTRGARTGRRSTGRARATTIAASASHARRTIRRSHSRRRCGRARPRTPERRVERPVDRRPRVGRHDGRRRDRGAIGADPGAQARSGGGLLGAPRRRRRRQRRVGDTSWTDRNRKTTERTSQVATLFGQNVSRATPNGARVTSAIRDRPSPVDVADGLATRDRSDWTTPARARDPPGPETAPRHRLAGPGR